MTRKARAHSTSFSTFTDRYVTELLAGRGWRRSGLAFENRNALDDCVYIGLQRSSSSLGKVIDFYVNRNVSPRPWREYKTSLMHVAADNWDAQLALGVFIAWRLQPPRHVSDDPTGKYVSDAWRVDLADDLSIESCGVALRAALADAAVDLEELLDRDTLRVRAAQDARHAEDLLELLLDVDEGQSISTFRLAGMNANIVDWLVARGMTLAERP